MIVILNRIREGIRRISLQMFNQLQRELQEEVVLLDSVHEANGRAYDAEVLVCFNQTLSVETLRSFSGLKWVHSMTSGVDKLPIKWLADSGIVLTNSMGIHKTQIAEQMIGTMICFTRGLHLNLRQQLQRKWATPVVPEQLAGKTIAILGAGSIGQELARKCKAFDMRVIGVRRSEGLPEHFDRMATMRQLPEVLQTSDFVAVLVPLTPNTRHMFGSEQFAFMKRTAVFLNFARGGVVDEPALIQALQDGVIAGAGLDVFSEEPLPREHPFWGMEQVIVSPHSSGLTAHLEFRELELFQQLFTLYRNNEVLFNQVSLEQKN